ncbi:hypothetical protein BS50DRAFT_671324 [Corynespora cassiicola Philippines]|uniref:Uncharacterized protein n=1 Tax=Corynespora cassiicola Philippines TaxID=1448308 RepID=A0A2T2PBM9_CORCC|nr:hypothetical protein BS50DRAFT_671324 [Corynespora cassiicola Philippines]
MRVSPPLVLSAAISVLSLNILALPSIPSPLPRLLPRDKPLGICSKTNLPTEASYFYGIERYCGMFIKRGPDKYHAMQLGNPLTGTVWLDNYEGGEQIPWVFKASLSREKNYEDFTVTYHLTYDKCIEEFKLLLTDGDVGKQYCVVDGTKDVLFKKGKVAKEFDNADPNPKKNKPKAFVEFESRRRRGD